MRDPDPSEVGVLYGIEHALDEMNERLERIANALERLAPTVVQDTQGDDDVRQPVIRND